MRWSSVVLVAPVLTGCSLIYNPNNLPDPRMIDAAIPDVNPAMPVVLDFAPDRIDEGQGEGGSLPALLVLHGQNLVNAHTKLVLTPPSGTTVNVETVGDVSVSSGGDYVAFQVVAHVDGNLTGPVMLEVAVTQDVTPQYGGGTATSVPPVKRLLFNGLPELTGKPEITSGVLTTQLLQPKYSRVDLMKLGTVQLASDPKASTSQPALINAVSSITTAALTASATNDKAGPGGFNGAVAKGQGPGGGAPGTASQVDGTGGGGGGAGFATIGGNGQGGGVGGSMGGAGGAAAGNDLIVPLEANLPSAGGGGGAGSLVGGASGGAGGGGGGVVELIAGGDITTDTLTAGGGTGDAGAAGVGSGGGGGGGAGGVVLVSSASGVVKTGAITVPAGGGGSPNGGASSVGRVRWDAIGDTAPQSPSRPAHRGPAFMVPARIVTRSPQTFTLLGTKNDGFSIRVTDQQNTMHDGGHASFTMDNTAMISPTLYPGYNQICITLDGGMQGHVEADKCIDVAYLP